MAQLRRSIEVNAETQLVTAVRKVADIDKGGQGQLDARAQSLDVSDAKMAVAGQLGLQVGILVQLILGTKAEASTARWVNPSKGGTTLQAVGNLTYNQLRT